MMPFTLMHNLPNQSEEKPILAMTKPEFKRFTIIDVLTALQSKAHPGNRIYVEVQRLVDNYVVVLRYYWDNNGNTLPTSIIVPGIRPIEKIAMDFALKGLAKKLEPQPEVTVH